MSQNILLKLSEIEIKACLKLYELNKAVTASELADALNIKPSFLSRVLKKLDEKGLVAYEKKGATKYLRNSDLPHSQKLRDIYFVKKNTGIEKWLSGYAMDVLVILSDSAEGIEFDLLQRETVCSRSNLYSVYSKLSRKGIVSKNKDIVRISDPLLLSFAHEYANNIETLLLYNIILSTKKGTVGTFYNKRIRKHMFLRTGENRSFTETGMTYLSKKGLEAILSWHYYYSCLDGAEMRIDLDKAFVHAIVFSMSQVQDRLLLANYYYQNSFKLNMIEIKKEAKTLGVSKELEGIIQIAENYKRLGAIQ